jgi:hypothetical protein
VTSFVPAICSSCVADLQGDEKSKNVNCNSLVRNLESGTNNIKANEAAKRADMAEQRRRIMEIEVQEAAINKKRNTVVARLARRKENRAVMSAQLSSVQDTMAQLLTATHSLNRRVMQSETRHRRDYCHGIKSVDVKGRKRDHKTPTHIVPKRRHGRGMEATISLGSLKSFETSPLSKMSLPRLSLSKSSAGLK